MSILYVERGGTARTAATGLGLAADDGPFTAGSGPRVSGSTLALVMTTAGRTTYLGDLSGPGAATLRARVAQSV